MDHLPLLSLSLLAMATAGCALVESPYEDVVETSLDCVLEHPIEDLIADIEADWGGSVELTRSRCEEGGGEHCDPQDWNVGRDAALCIAGEQDPEYEIEYRVGYPYFSTTYGSPTWEAQAFPEAAHIRYAVIDAVTGEVLTWGLAEDTDSGC